MFTKALDKLEHAWKQTNDEWHNACNDDEREVWAGRMSGPEYLARDIPRAAQARATLDELSAQAISIAYQIRRGEGLDEYVH
jgi:hypothetical protein